MGTARNFDVIVMGGSSGALDALAKILPALPAAFPIPIALVIHVPPGRPSHLSDVLSTKCALSVREADDKEPLLPATLYVAPPDYHLLVERQRCFSLSVDSPINFSRPSIDVLFESAADAYGASVFGVLLSGASDDGARGLAKIKSAGGATLAQSPESSTVPTMPAAAMNLDAVDHVVSLADIGPFLARLPSRPWTARSSSEY